MLSLVESCWASAFTTFELALTILLAITSCAMAQQTVEELRNNYNFLQAGLSTLAAGTSVALCLARGRLDAEMGIADFFTLVRLKLQNDYKSYYAMGANGVVIGVHVHPKDKNAAVGDPNPNTVMWARHNTWAQGSTIALVPFQIGPPNPVLIRAQTGQAQAATPSPDCTCWHIPSVTASAVGGMPALPGILVPTADTQAFRIPSYQCALHGQDHMDKLHQYVQSQLSLKLTLEIALQAHPTDRDHHIPHDLRVVRESSRLFEVMKGERDQCTYFFGVDKIGGRCLTRMVSESLATLDASEKGRTSDLVEWSLNRLDLSEKSNVKWVGSSATVVIVVLLEFLLMLVLSLVFGLDPFVSSLGARRSVRSLRLGPGGVTSFADLWLQDVKGYKYEGWETPILRVRPRENMWVWYWDLCFKILGVVVVWSFWIASVMGLVHPIGLDRNQAWGNNSVWTIYVGSIGSIVGFVTCLMARSNLQSRLHPGARKDKGFGLLHWCLAECAVEIAMSILRLSLPHSSYFMRASRYETSSITKWLRRTWYVVLEIGIWMQWVTAKRSLSAGPHSDSRGIPWVRTVLLAGALARATILAAVSGNWK